MKTFEAYLNFLKENPLFIEGFGNKEDVFREFAEPVDDDVEIAYASYLQGNYDGTASLIYFRKSTEKWYEVYGSHCSCYGLEGQWERDEEVVFAELEKRLTVFDSLMNLRIGFEEFLNK